ncbi:MAG: DUF4351 domain-containing protein [Candidatus Viridilinea halotolerans]|uniref:DUF4351 domain-containing protein n=1 Tax=Candidatus Viridilinea halotolerans TaxID=2491704 RepID=A0A426TR05_9CHLR|nr:MAG: DUF4351 domain-containing protein [Candidatus Viridilinea halotolerans]
MALDHDGIFKQLLSSFLVEFFELFAPDLLTLLDPSAFILLQTDSFVDLLDPDRRTADLLIQAQLRGAATTILIHLEHQAQHDDVLDRRMFRYFARFYDRYNTLIAPLALCSYRSPRRTAATSHQMAVGRRRVLDFQYQVIQLNQLAWRDYLDHPNPLATALMACMRMAPKERWLVKAACFRQLAGMPLAPAQQHMLATFVSIYLPLNGPEAERFQAEIATWQPAPKESMMEFMNEWELKGMRKGKKEGMRKGKKKGIDIGKKELLLHILSLRCGSLPAVVQAKINALDAAQILALSEALLGFASLDDLHAWLAQLELGAAP